MPKDVKANINKDNEKFIQGIKKDLKKEFGVEVYHRFGKRRQRLDNAMAFVEEKLDGKPISALNIPAVNAIKAKLVTAVTRQPMSFKFDHETSNKLDAAEKLVTEHGRNDKARHQLYRVCKSMDVANIEKLNHELHTMDKHPMLKNNLMTLKKSGSSIDAVDCMRNVSQAKAPNFLISIYDSFEKGKISAKNLSLLTEATKNARSDDAVHARVSLLKKECHSIFGWDKKMIHAMSDAFNEKPQKGWEDKISSMTPKERALEAARLIGTYPEICNAVMEANGKEISNRKLLNAVAAIQEQALLRHNEQGSNKHGKSSEALRPEIMAQIEAQLVTDPKAKDVVKKVLEVNDFAKLGDHGRVDPKAAINVVLVANYPHLCSGLGGKDGVNFKANTPHDNSIPKQLADMKIQGEKRMTDEQKDAGLKPLRMYEEEMKLAKDEPQRVAVLDPHNNNKFDTTVADNSKEASEARSAERGAARVSQLEKLVERSSRESARQSGGRH